jgi:hypothetical protein
MGRCGISNYNIFMDTRDVINSGFLTSDDIIIVMFSYPYRYLSNIKDMSISELFFKFEEILKDYKHFYFNSFFPSFQEEDGFDFNRLPNTFINPKESVNTILEEYEVNNNISVWEYDTKRVYDGDIEYKRGGGIHPNLIGYKLIADYVYQNIKDKI